MREIFDIDEGEFRNYMGIFKRHLENGNIRVLVDEGAGILLEVQDEAKEAIKKEVGKEEEDYLEFTGDLLKIINAFLSQREKSLKEFFLEGDFETEEEKQRVKEKIDKWNQVTKELFENTRPDREVKAKSLALYPIFENLDWEVKRTLDSRDVWKKGVGIAKSAVIKIWILEEFYDRLGILKGYHKHFGFECTKYDIEVFMEELTKIKKSLEE